VAPPVGQLAEVPRSIPGRSVARSRTYHHHSIDLGGQRPQQLADLSGNDSVHGRALPMAPMGSPQHGAGRRTAARCLGDDGRRVWHLGGFGADATRTQLGQTRLTRPVPLGALDPLPAPRAIERGHGLVVTVEQNHPPPSIDDRPMAADGRLSWSRRRTRPPQLGGLGSVPIV
jgi:hypothetical protein